MKFAIRDDDTNYFTTPRDLEEAYSSIWDICPITLFLVPYMKGDWKYWVRERYFYYESLDFNKYWDDNKIYPIGENKELVHFLKNKINEGKVELGIHGIHHRNSERYLPEVKSNRVENAEFFTQQNLSHKLLEAKDYLENVFKQNISVFSPPQNLVSSKGAKAVKNCNLSIIRNREKKRIILNIYEIGFSNTVKILSHGIQKSFFKNTSDHYPHILKKGNTVEITHYSFHPATNLKNLKRNIYMINKQEGVFVLSTHYYALQQSFDSNLSMRSDLLNIVKELDNNKGIYFCGLDSLVKNQFINK